MIIWEQQTCLLTGATGGIGEAIARKLDTLGCTLILCGRNEVKLTQLKQTLSPRHSCVVADINTQAGRKSIELACQAMGKLTLLINNAGVSQVNEFLSNDEDDIERLVHTNLLSPMLVTRQLLPQLQRQLEARIVNIGSVFGSIGFAGHTTYCATKFGLRGFTEALHRELAGSSVSVHYLAPRATDTKINSESVIAMNRALGNHVDQPEVVADALVAQLEAKQSRKTIGFPEKLFARINGALPGLVDRALRKKLPTIKQFISRQQQEIA